MQVDSEVLDQLKGYGFQSQESVDLVLIANGLKQSTPKTKKRVTEKLQTFQRGMNEFVDEVRLGL